jgi:acyl carrier protein
MCSLSFGLRPKSSHPLCGWSLILWAGSTNKKGFKTRFAAPEHRPAGAILVNEGWMQTYEELLSLVIEMIRPLAPQGRQIDERTDLVSDLEFDSLKVMSLIERVEDRFDISIPLNILPDIRTVRDFTVQLQNLLRKT